LPWLPGSACSQNRSSGNPGAVLIGVCVGVYKMALYGVDLRACMGKGKLAASVAQKYFPITDRELVDPDLPFCFKKE